MSIPSTIRPSYIRRPNNLMPTYDNYYSGNACLLKCSVNPRRLRLYRTRVSANNRSPANVSRICSRFLFIDLGCESDKANEIAMESACCTFRPSFYLSPAKTVNIRFARSVARDTAINPFVARSFPRDAEPIAARECDLQYVKRFGMSDRNKQAF